MKGQKTGGRTKGTPNKVNAELRDMILGALSDAGGQKYLLTQALDNPASFMSLLGRILPKEITGKDGEPLIPSLADALKVARERSTKR